VIRGTMERRFQSLRRCLRKRVLDINLLIKLSYFSRCKSTRKWFY
jgi:hypothetical protein